MNYKRFFKGLFSIRNEYRDSRKYKRISILGLNFKLKVLSSINSIIEYYSFIENYENQNKDDFVPITKENYNNSSTIKPIAFYLPQFHSIPLNDENFCKGFSEWTNVTKAIPQFKGHNQPHLPIDVGFYDLSRVDVMYRQVELAKMYGIYGFCFHYYWFSGKRLLEKPIFNYLKNKDLDLPFCLCWANENWSKLWDGGNKEVIIKQNLDNNDDEKFFYDILPFFKDERYIRIDNKPILIIYRLNLFEKERVKLFIKNIKNLAKKEGFNGIYVIGALTFEIENSKDYGADANVEFPPHNILQCGIQKLKYLNKNFKGNVFNMQTYINNLQIEDCLDLYKTVFPNWDNTARKARTSAGVFQCSPDMYKSWLSKIVEWTKKNHSISKRFIFINAWNEWGEGAHLEPDQKYGYAYLQATKDVLEKDGIDYDKKNHKEDKITLSV